MRIAPLYTDVALRHLHAARQASADQPTTAARTGAAQAGVSVEVASMSTSSPVDTARVAELRAAIADGSYKLDPLATAQALIRSADLLKAQR